MEKNSKQSEEEGKGEGLRSNDPIQIRGSTIEVEDREETSRFGVTKSDKVMSSTLLCDSYSYCL